jgi:TonB family protein
MARAYVTGGPLVHQPMTAVAGAIALACALSLPAPAECPGTCLFDLNGVAKALQVGATFSGGSRLLAREGSARQQKLLLRLPDSQADLSRVPELQGFAARTAGPLNQALSRAGFGMRVSPWVDDGKHLGVVALLKFQMDQFGATVESSTVFAGPTGPPPTYYRLDGPFVAVIARAGVRTPIFAGYIGLDSFGDPRLAASRPSAPDARAAAAPQAPATPPREPVEEDEDIHRVGGAVTRPEKISAPPPVYTEMARRARLQGVVILEVVIDRNGKVKEAHVLKGMAMGLDRAAIEAVQKWKFKPATLEHRPVAVYYTVTVPFNLG